MQWLSAFRLKKKEGNFILYQVKFIETPDKPFIRDNSAMIYIWVDGDYHNALNYIEQHCEKLEDVYKFHNKKFNKDGLIEETTEDIENERINQEIVDKVLEQMKSIPIQDNNLNIVLNMFRDIDNRDLVIVGRFKLNNKEEVVSFRIPFDYLANHTEEENLRLIVLKTKCEVIKYLWRIIEDSWVKEFVGNEIFETIKKIGGKYAIS